MGILPSISLSVIFLNSTDCIILSLENSTNTVEKFQNILKAMHTKVTITQRFIDTSKKCNMLGGFWD